MNISTIILEFLQDNLNDITISYDITEKLLVCNNKLAIANVIIEQDAIRIVSYNRKNDKHHSLGVAIIILPISDPDCLEQLLQIIRKSIQLNIEMRELITSM